MEAVWNCKLLCNWPVFQEGALYELYGELCSLLPHKTKLHKLDHNIIIWFRFIRIDFLEKAGRDSDSSRQTSSFGGLGFRKKKCKAKGNLRPDRSSWKLVCSIISSHILQLKLHSNFYRFIFTFGILSSKYMKSRFA